MRDHFLRDFIYKVINRPMGRPISNNRVNIDSCINCISRSYNRMALLLSVIVLFTTLILPQNKICAYADELSGLSPTFSSDVSNMPYRVPMDFDYDLTHYSEWASLDKSAYFMQSLKDLVVSIAGVKFSNMADQTVQTSWDRLINRKIYQSSMSPDEWVASRFDLKKLGDNYEMAMTEDLYSLIIELANELKSQCDNDDDYRYGYSYDYRNYSYIGRDSDVIKAIGTIVKYAESNGYIVVADKSSPDLYVWKCEFYYVYYSSNSYGSCKVKKCLKENSSPDLLFYQYSGVSRRYELKSTYHSLSFNSPTVLLLQDNIDELKAGTAGNPSYAYYDNAIIGDGYIRYRIYDSEEDIVTPTYQEVSTTYYYYDSHNTDISDDDINNYIINYYNDNDRYPSTPEIIIYIQTIIPQPTPNPSPTPTPKPNTNTSTSDGVTVTQNANPVINVIVKIKNSLFPWGDDDEDEPETEEPTTEEPTSEEPTTEEPSSEDDPTKPIKERDEDDDNPFWWLKSIFKWLKEIISDVGYIFEGIISALNSVLHAIIGQKGADGKWEGGLPTVIGDLIAYFLPFLPPEIITLLELSILLTVIVAIIHIIRK